MLKKIPLKFGTDGWRGVIADEFTYENVQRISQAVCDVLRKKTKSNLILVGYDRRFFSDRFALSACNVATANGFQVELTEEPMSSPALSFQVKQRKAAIGFMITASHNPYQFNGFKLKGVHGGSVDEFFTNKVEDVLDISEIKADKAVPKKSDFVSGYLTSLKKNFNLTSFSKIKGPIIFDAMNGPGGVLFERLIGKSADIEYIRKEHDPLFGGTGPEPIESHLSLLKETVLKKKGSIGIAVDGDVDRIGIVDDKGRYLPPHTVMPLIILHMIENRKMKGKIVQTVSMGYLPERIAGQYKLPFEEVMVGFKYIAQKMVEEKILFGGEESGGYGVGLWAPERDGLLCALLLIELLAMKKMPLSELVDDLMKRFGVSHFKRIDFSLDRPINKPEWTANIQNLLQEGLPGFKIKKITTIDGIKIVLEDDSWVLMRPSGTEPLVRTYSEGTSEKIVSDLLKEADRLIHVPTEQEIKENKAILKNKKKKRPQ